MEDMTQQAELINDETYEINQEELSAKVLRGFLRIMKMR